MELEITLKFPYNENKPMKPFIFVKKGEKLTYSYYYPEPYDETVKMLRERGFTEEDIRIIIKVINNFGEFIEDVEEEDEDEGIL